MREVGVGDDCVFDGVRWRAVPQITMSLNFVLPSTNVGTITVACDAGQCGPATMHADFMNGWDQAVLTDLVEDCIQSVPDSATTEDKPAKCQDPGKL